MWYLDHMEKKYTEAELTKYDKELLISLFMGMQQLTENLSRTCEQQKVQLEQVNQTMKLILEQLSISNQKQFGRSSEKMVFHEQLEMCFNEAEVTVATKYVDEPEMEEVCPKSYKRIKTKGKREEDLKNLPVIIINHELSDEELKESLGDKWKRLPDEVYKRLAYHPARFEVEEHHVYVYAGRDNQTIVRGNRPVDLLRNSIATPSLTAAILNSKYVNAIPLYRLEQEFSRNDLVLGRQVMANWTIQCGERYLSLLYNRLHKEIYNCNVLQADETPVEVSKDGRPAGSKSYMWVYRTGKMYDASPIVLYEYQKTRNTSHPREFLKDYSGTVVTDGYQVYHTLEKERENLKIAGCWSHARRRFATVVKALGEEKAKGTLAYDALKQIAEIYKIEGSLAEQSPEERQRQRQLTIKPLVEAFFAWVNQHQEQNSALPKSETGKGFTYCLNQEKYLKAFLEDGNIPADNNAAEASIRGFCIGKHNWHLIDTIDGAKASAIIYSIAETAKANNLKPYEYFQLLLTEIPKHMDDTNLNFLEALLPWSDSLPAECRKQNQK
jgi:transposase